MARTRPTDRVNSLPLNGYVTFTDDGRSKRWTCTSGCQLEPCTGPYASVREHLIGGAYDQGSSSKAVPLCDKVPENVREQTKKEEDKAKASLRKIRIKIKSRPPPPPPPSDPNVLKVINDVLASLEPPLSFEDDGPDRNPLEKPKSNCDMYRIVADYEALEAYAKEEEQACLKARERRFLYATRSLCLLELNLRRKKGIWTRIFCLFWS